MRKIFRLLITSASVITIASVMGFTTNVAVASDSVEEGKELAFDRKKGNCLACHAMKDGEMAGNIGPPLIAMKVRFPDKEVLKAQIYEPRTKNPNTIMPPFGTHSIISEEEIDKIVEYVLTL